MEKKQMEYKFELTKPILLYQDDFLGFDYYVCSVGTHPTAYIKINKENKHYGKDPQELGEIHCHGGITYTDNYLGKDGEIVPKSYDYWIIGWDYAHSGDYTGYDQDRTCYKKWTPTGIIEEIKEVIVYLHRQQYPEEYGVHEMAPERLKISIRKILQEHGLPIQDEDEILLETDLGLTRVILPEKYKINDEIKKEIENIFPYFQMIKIWYR